MRLDNLRVVLVRPRFPENIGMAARACANMGCDSLAVVCPELWRSPAVYSLATPKGKSVVDNCAFYPDLASALASCHRAYAATARLGGWRKRALPPEKCAAEALALAESGKSAALVFGPEDKGLNNAEISQCANIVSIKTHGEASSLNLAQAVLLLLYECARLWNASPRRAPAAAQGAITVAEKALLEENFKRALLLLDCLGGKNPDYYFLQWSRLLDRASLSRSEYSAFMGLCRQITNKLAAKDEKCQKCAPQSSR